MKKGLNIDSIAVRMPSDEEVNAMKQSLYNAFNYNRYGRLKARLLAIEMLRLFKSNLPYKILSELTNIPESVLCRYTRGAIIPSFEQAVNILAHLTLSVDINYLLRKLVEQEKSNIIDLSRVLKDPYVTRLLSVILYLELIDLDITMLVVTADYILPLASLLGLELNASIIPVKKKAYPGVNYYSAVIPRSPKDVEAIFIDKDLVNRNDKLLVLADVVYTGVTLKTVLSLLEKSRATISAIIVILGLGELWRDELKQYDVRVLTQIPFPTVFE